MTDTTTPRTHVEHELASQPECWAQAVAAAARARSPACRRRASVSPSSVAARRCTSPGRTPPCARPAVHGETDAFPASEYRVRPALRPCRGDLPLGDDDRGARRARADRAPTTAPTITAITVDGATPIAALADATSIALAVRRRAVGGADPLPDHGPGAAARLARRGPRRASSPPAPAAVSSPLPVAAGDVRQITFLGSGWAAAIAEEAALKCREAAGFWTESYPAMEYRHGPISVSGPGTVVWVFGDPPRGLADDVGGDRRAVRERRSRSDGRSDPRPAPRRRARPPHRPRPGPPAVAVVQRRPRRRPALR